MRAFMCRGPCGPLSVLVLITAISLVTGHAHAQTIPVVVDEAKLVKLPDRVATLVIGNPLIADVSLQAGGLMVVTGKGYGATNIIALDRGGAVLMERMIEVKTPGDHLVVVYRGVERETYSCAPHCERRITLGDGQTYFDQTMNQTLTRAGGAMGISQGSRAQ